MAREKQDFRENLELITLLFPNRAALDVNEACSLLGCHRDTLTNDKAFPLQKIKGKWIVPVVGLARWLS